MKKIQTVLTICLALLVSANVSGAKKPKGIIIPEGDNAVLSTEGSFTTITLPETLSAEEMELYNTDLVGYLIRLNAKISSDGSDYNGGKIYYYMHNSKEWLHKGQYELPAQMNVQKIKSIKIAKSMLRLREFNKQMPLLDGHRDKKNDTAYQNELLEGENRYIFIDITLRD
ncbi:MAG: hypothetical protein J5732_05655 [Bacteroidaceae bacterium]|nr:hypothetical protein [Bacteroidaceae bacterium]